MRMIVTLLAVVMAAASVASGRNGVNRVRARPDSRRRTLEAGQAGP